MNDTDPAGPRRADIFESTGPGPRPEEDEPRGERISVGGGDENVAKIQLAARWAEQYAPASGDSLDAALRRFKQAYMYVDSVTKLVEPD